MTSTRAVWVVGWVLAGWAPLQAQDVRTHIAALREGGQYDEAIALARDQGLQEMLGEALLDRGRLADAERAFLTAIAEGDPDSLMARLHLAILQHRRGELEAARRGFDAFIDIYNAGRRLTSRELEAVGTAVQFLSAYDPALAHDALRAYDEAIARDPTNLDARLKVGQLFLDRYNGTEARAAFEEVLSRSPDHPRALLGMARTARFEGSRRAMQLVQRALDRNPNLVPARIFLAELYLELDQRARAAEELGRALATDPASLEALAVQAALAVLAGDSAGYRDLERAALRRNPANATLYTTVADALARTRRYREAAAFARQAIARDSVSWRGYALLGINELRLGAMDSGRIHLERAFAGDPFDIWTKNTLDLLDTLEDFPATSSDRFRFFVEPDESALLSLYLADVAEAAFDSLSARYGYRPQTPIRVEVFGSHADFSVRTVGLVGLGALGVSFGPVIAMDAPSAREVGSFNWGSTLWHEIAHTFHLGFTDHRVPRWFTEGLAVYEERRARPGWGDDLTPAFLAAFKQGRLLSVPDLNEGFIRPAYPEQLAFSYYQGSLVAEYIEETYGLAGLRGLLEAYRDGLTTADAFQRVFDRGPERFDREYTRWFRDRFAGPLAALVPPDSGAPSPERIAQRARRDPGDFIAQLSYGRMLVRDGRLDEAVPFLERARALFPQHADAQSAYTLLAQIHEARGNLREAAAQLARLTAINERAYEPLLKLADLRLTLGDTLGAIGALRRAIYVSPYNLALHRRLAELAEAREQFPLAVRERRAILALRPVNLADAWYRLAAALHRAGDNSGARRAVLRALELAPSFAEAQELLLDLHDERR